MNRNLNRLKPELLICEETKQFNFDKETENHSLATKITVEPYKTSDILIDSFTFIKTKFTQLIDPIEQETEIDWVNMFKKRIFGQI